MLSAWLFKKGSAPKEAHRSQHSSSWTSSYQQRGRLGEDGDLPRGHTIKWQSWDRILDRWLSSAFSPHCLSRAGTSLCSALSWQTEQDRCVPRPPGVGPCQALLIDFRSSTVPGSLARSWDPRNSPRLPELACTSEEMTLVHKAITPALCGAPRAGPARLGHPCGCFPAPHSPNEECDLGLGLWAQITSKLLAHKGYVLSPKIEKWLISTLFSC